MTTKYKVRNDEGEVIGQFEQNHPPEKPEEWDGAWHVEEADKLNDEPVNWFRS